MADSPPAPERMMAPVSILALVEQLLAHWSRGRVWLIGKEEPV
jgi:hypothetical protein